MVVFVASVLVGGVALICGVGSAYQYHQQGGCPSVLGWWDVEPAPFQISLVSSLVGCAALWASARRRRCAAAVLLAAVLGLWLWIGSASAAERVRLQQVYRLQSGLAASAPLPPDALSTDPDRCVRGGSSLRSAPGATAKAQTSAAHPRTPGIG
jgi:hypothetical protein